MHCCYLYTNSESKKYSNGSDKMIKDCAFLCVARLIILCKELNCKRHKMLDQDHKIILYNQKIDIFICPKWCVELSSQEKFGMPLTKAILL